ncbi:hypothetical protein [Streptomyces sp. NPDC005077]|uniref:hypothetical protein n=1 Tax=Streptomyces sp. NPDC005077 TaxID=3154292 RepID=UPI0033B217A0
MTAHMRIPWRRTPAWPVALLWTLALGAWGISRDGSLWRDEAATWQVALRDASGIWHLLGQVDAVHGLYYLLMHGLFECFGPSAVTLRLPSVIAMGVAAACVAALGQRLAGYWAGLGGGLAFGLLPAVQFYLQEGRPYALVAAGAGISTLLLVQSADRRGRARTWAAYGAVVLICALLNWLSLLILLAHLATLMCVKAERIVWVRWGLAAALATAGALPLILFSRSQSAQVSWIPPLTWHMLIAPAIMLLIGSIGAWAARPRLGQLSLATVGLPLLAVPQVGLIVISLFQPLFLDRYILFSLLGLALLLGSTLAAAVQYSQARFPRASVFVVPLTLVVAVAALLPQFLIKRAPESRVDDVLAIAADVQRVKEAGDAVVYVPAARRDTALVSPRAFEGVQDIALAVGPVESGTLKGLESSPEQIREAMLRQKRILLVTDAPGAARPVSARRDRAKAAVLKEHFAVVADEQVRGRRLTVYEKRD